ncbi:hypothetical protein PIROE2DRAFT_47266, partial [Piromyces sp. E2]
FFSYTENSMEISIIADVETIEKDFPKNNSPICPGLCICEDPFRALQIDNEYGLEMSGKRINDLSAPLAQAGISIFYLSTYQTDFIFVKEKRIPLVVSVLKKSFQFIDLDLLNIEFPMYLNNNDEQFLPPENVSSWLKDILVEVRRQCKKSLSDKNLRLIGLNREYMEGWALVMMKIMFYPELLKTEEEIEK